MRRSGDATELRAVIWLWEQGYEVFNNVAADGPIDLVAIDANGVAIKVDVKKALEHTKKTPRWQAGKISIGRPQITERQKSLDVKILLETSEGFFWADDITGKSIWPKAM